MADADVRLTTVSKDGEKLGNLIPAGSLSKADGKDLVVDLTLSGSAVKSVQTPFGNQPFMAEIEESEELFGMHVTMGGFPMKAWLSKDGAMPQIRFSNGGRWTKI